MGSHESAVGGVIGSFVCRNTDDDILHGVVVVVATVPTARTNHETEGTLSKKRDLPLLSMCTEFSQLL